MKTPACKPCFMYADDIDKSPYELSYKLVNEPLRVGELELGNGITGYERSAAYQYSEATNYSGCLVNVVVVHPAPDQCEGVLGVGFTYTGWEAPKDEVLLQVSKYSPMGAFENNVANWEWMWSDGLW